VLVSGSPAPTLTIQAGVTVKFNAGKGLVISWPSGGVLIANGTSASPIVLTANGSTTPGFWSGLYLGSNTPTVSQLAYVTVQYGGLTSLARGGIYIENTSPTLGNITSRNNVVAGFTLNGGTLSLASCTVTANSGPGFAITTGSASISGCTITSNTGNGVDVTAGSAAVSSSTISSNTGYPISAAAPVSLTGLTGLTISGNGPGKDMIERRGGTMATSQTWLSTAVPYAVTGTVQVSGSPAPTLTIQAGVTAKFSAGQGLVVNWPSGGILNAIGTSGSRIVLTANGSTTPGFWSGLYLGSQTATASQVAYLTVEYGGYAPLTRGGVYTENTSPTLGNITSRNNIVAGITVNGGSPTITNCTITGNGGPGINVTAGNVSVSSSTITNNTGYAISVPVASALTGLTGLTISGNGPGKDMIERRGGTLATSQTWLATSVPYAVTTTIQVSGSPAPTLTIQAGVTVKFSAGQGLGINWPSGGILNAVGTSGSPILFTANGSTTPGFWGGLYLGSQTATPSQVAYLTVEYGGYAALTRGGIYTENLSPSLGNITSRNNIVAGITVNGGSPTITNCTITGNSGPGIDIVGGNVSVTSSTISNNTGYAISVPVTTALTGLTGLTVSGNGPGKDMIERRGGTIATSKTWVATAVPYAVTGTIQVSGSPAPTLTIQPGVTAKFSAGQGLVISWPSGGVLLANGTAAAPIVLSANGSTSPGFWNGLYLGNLTPTHSQIAYMTVEYGGNAPYSRGGMHVEFTSPTIDHATTRNNIIAGISVIGGSPTITNTSFSGNPAGLTASGTTKVSARFNYWGTVNGPSGAGPGTGQSVATGVSFEPWLTISPSQPQFFNAFVQKNKTFNPNLSINTTLIPGTVLAGNWTVTILNSGGATVRTYNGTGTGGSVVWDGKNGSGVDQPNGTYNYQLAATATGGAVAATARGRSVLDRNAQLTPTNIAVAPPFFSPNADTVQDTTIVSASNAFDDTTWTVNVKNSGGVTVRTYTSNVLDLATTWDGKNGSAVVQPDGVYTFAISLANGTATASGSATCTLDNTLPVGTFVSPTAGQTISNVYTNGNTNHVVTGTATDTNFNNYTLDYGVGPSPGTFTAIQSGTSPVSAAALGTFATDTLTNGTYTLRLRVWDKAGNLRTTPVSPVVGHFRVSQDVLQFNGSSGGAVTYSSIVPFALNETLVIKNGAGATVRTLVNAVARTANTYLDPWNGRNGSNVLQPDAGYFYFATVTTGPYTFTWDLSTQYLNNYNGYNDSLGLGGWDPFKNTPLTFNYNFPQPGRVSIGMSTFPGYVPNTCTPPGFCLLDAVYQESGPKTIQWAGVDHTGAFRGDIKSIGVVTQRFQFAKNAVVLFGTRPSVTNVKVTPPVYGPAVGTQLVEYDLAASQGPCTVTVTFLKQESLSVLRTVTQTGVTAGHKSITWDGRADNGMWVAPGVYTVTVTATDAIGNQVKGQILTRIMY
jgi:flagellar hook assembly protein FlgD